jgi:hypothetical protein
MPKRTSSGSTSTGSDRRTSSTSLGIHHRVVVPLARVDADSQPLFRPPQRLQRSPGVAGGVLDVHIAATGGAVQTGVMQEGRAQQDFAVIANPAGVSEALGDQILAHRVAFHVTVGLAGSHAQRLERRGLGLRADELVRAPPAVSAHVLPRERPILAWSSCATCRWGLSARFARHIADVARLRDGTDVATSLQAKDGKFELGHVLDGRWTRGGRPWGSSAPSPSAGDVPQSAPPKPPIRDALFHPAALASARR